MHVCHYERSEVISFSSFVGVLEHDIFIPIHLERPAAGGAEAVIFPASN